MSDCTNDRSDRLKLLVVDDEELLIMNEDEILAVFE